MIRLRKNNELELMKISGKVVGEILHDLAEFVKPGISTMDINKFVEDRIYKEDMYPTFLGYNGFPAGACVSINEEIVHGIPDENRILSEGDIVSIDIGATYKGYISDAARTYPVGEISEEARMLIDACEKSFFAGLKCCTENNKLSDIGNAVQESAEGDGYSVVREFVGHGVGTKLHEDPQIPNYGKPGRGPKLLSGMVLAIEPMVNVGSYEAKVLIDNWTAVTKDGKLSAHYENTVVITSGMPEVITLDDRDRREER